jgi:hypothetical protein
VPAAPTQSGGLLWGTLPSILSGRARALRSFLITHSATWQFRIAPIATGRLAPLRYDHNTTITTPRVTQTIGHDCLCGQRPQEAAVISYERSLRVHLCLQHPPFLAEGREPSGLFTSLGLEHGTSESQQSQPGGSRRSATITTPRVTQTIGHDCLCGQRPQEAAVISYERSLRVLLCLRHPHNPVGCVGHPVLPGDGLRC